MNYAPRNMYVWDAWCMNVKEEVHAYHLQLIRPNVNIPKELEDHLGHAISRNLIDWEERPVAFGPDPSKPLDDALPYTGCALWHRGKGYLFYTMRGKAENCLVQRIGLATTYHPDQWERFSGNPVIQPDPRWYAVPGDPIPNLLDCRDMIVVAAPGGKGWLGFYATRKPGKELPETSVIGCAYSDDLIHWEHRPPAFAPEKYAALEVPDVFELNGRWYLTCLVGNSYGNRGIWFDSHLNHGTMYAVAERPEGPYVELRDNAFVAACTLSPVSCRSLLFEGKRYVLYTDRERVGHTDVGPYAYGSLSTPKEVRTDGDRLYAAYSSLIESRVTGELIRPHSPIPHAPDHPAWGHAWHWDMPTVTWDWGEVVSGSSRTGWGVAPLEVEAESFIFDATIILENAVAAGLVVRIKGLTDGAFVGLDAEEQTVFWAETSGFHMVERRQTPIYRNTPIYLRIVNRLEHVEIYVNDELRLAFSRYRGIGGKVGLFVDRGRACFKDIRLRALDVSRPY